MFLNTNSTSIKSRVVFLLLFREEKKKTQTNKQNKQYLDNKNNQLAFSLIPVVICALLMRRRQRELGDAMVPWFRFETWVPFLFFFPTLGDAVETSRSIAAI